MSRTWFNSNAGRIFTHCQLGMTNVPTRMLLLKNPHTRHVIRNWLYLSGSSIFHPGLSRANISSFIHGSCIFLYSTFLSSPKYLNGTYPWSFAISFINFPSLRNQKRLRGPAAARLLWLPTTGRRSKASVAVMVAAF